MHERWCNCCFHINTFIPLDILLRILSYRLSVDQHGRRPWRLMAWGKWWVSKETHYCVQRLHCSVKWRSLPPLPISAILSIYISVDKKKCNGPTGTVCFTHKGGGWWKKKVTVLVRTKEFLHVPVDLHSKRSLPRADCDVNFDSKVSTAEQPMLSGKILIPLLYEAISLLMDLISCVCARQCERLFPLRQFTGYAPTLSASKAYIHLFFDTWKCFHTSGNALYFTKNFQFLKFQPDGQYLDLYWYSLDI